MSERESPQAPNWGNLPFPAIKLIAQLRFSNVFFRQILNLLGIFNSKSDISIYRLSLAPVLKPQKIFL